MVLVANLLNHANRGSEPQQLVATVDVIGNDSAASENPPASEGGRATRNPLKPPVYRVTSLPLDAYAEAAKNRMHMQDEGMGGPTVRISKTLTIRWRECCWIGW